jgi:chromosome segregation ATPase
MDADAGVKRLTAVDDLLEKQANEILELNEKLAHVTSRLELCDVADRSPCQQLDNQDARFSAVHTELAELKELFEAVLTKLDKVEKENAVLQNRTQVLLSRQRTMQSALSWSR